MWSAEVVLLIISVRERYLVSESACQLQIVIYIIQGIHQYWIYYSNYKTHRAFKN